MSTTESVRTRNVLYGSALGLTATGNQFWYQGSGIQGTAETSDRFGYALAAIPTVRHKVFLPAVLREY